jgi:hypothetical protein
VPSLNDGGNIFCDGDEYPDENETPEFDLTTHPFNNAGDLDYCHQLVADTYGECICRGPGQGAQGGVTVNVYQINPGNTYGIPDPLFGSPRPLWVMTINWSTCAASGSPGDGTYTAWYGCDKDTCGTKTFSKIVQLEGLSPVTNTTVNWPDEITLHNGTCP